MAYDLRTRIMDALKAKGWSARKASLEAGLSETAVRDIIGNPTQSPRMVTIDALAHALDVDRAWLAFGLEPVESQEIQGPLPARLTGELRPASGAFSVARVDGFVQAGMYVEIETLESDEGGEVISAPKDPLYPYARQVAYQVRGNSMNALKPRPIREGDYAICVAFEDTGLQPATGMVVVVQQTRDGGHLRERSLKQIELHPDRIEFHPRSTDPKHQPIVVPLNDDPDDGREVVILSLLRFTFDNVPVQF